MNITDFSLTNADDTGALFDIFQHSTEQHHVVIQRERKRTPGKVRRHSVSVIAPSGYDLGGGYAYSFAEAVDVAQRTIDNLPY